MFKKTETKQKTKVATMIAFVWIFGGLFFWFLFGCVMLAVIDKDQRLFLWTKQCPIPGGYVLTVMAWPVIVYMWRKEGWQDRTNERNKR